MDIFDLKNAHEKMQESLSNTIKSLKDSLEEKKKSLESFNEKTVFLQQNIKILESTNNSILEKYNKLESEHESSKRKWNSEKTKMTQDLNIQDNLIKHNLPFQDTTNVENLVLNNSSYSFETHVHNN